MAFSGSQHIMGGILQEGWWIEFSSFQSEQEYKIFKSKVLNTIGGRQRWRYLYRFLVGLSDLGPSWANPLSPNYLINFIELLLINQSCLERSFTSSIYTTLYIYQNTLMDKCEQSTQLTFINYVTMETKLEWEPLGPIGKYWFSQNPILKLTQHSNTKS